MNPNFVAPIVLYDGECGFCTSQVERLANTFGAKATFLPYQEYAKHFGVPEEEAAQAIQLIDENGERYSGAGAILKLYALNPLFAPVWFLYQYFPFFKPILEAVYAIVARHRGKL